MRHTFQPRRAGERQGCPVLFDVALHLGAAWALCMGLLLILPSTLPPPRAWLRSASAAFDERRKIHDLLMEGVELALKKRGYPALAEMKAKWQRKER